MMSENPALDWLLRIEPVYKDWPSNGFQFYGGRDRNPYGMEPVFVDGSRVGKLAYYVYYRLGPFTSNTPTKCTVMDFLNQEHIRAGLPPHKELYSYGDYGTDRTGGEEALETFGWIIFRRRRDATIFIEHMTETLYSCL